MKKCFLMRKKGLQKRARAPTMISCSTVKWIHRRMGYKYPFEGLATTWHWNPILLELVQKFCPQISSPPFHLKSTA